MNTATPPAADAAALPPGFDFNIVTLMARLSALAYDRRGERLLSKAEVVAKTGISPTDLWRMCEEGRFPQPRLRSPTRLCWIESEIDQWIAKLPPATGKLATPNTTPATAKVRRSAA